LHFGNIWSDHGTGLGGTHRGGRPRIGTRRRCGNLLERLLGGRLLRILLRAAGAGAGDFAVDHGGGGEVPVVRRPFHRQRRIGHRSPQAREAFLKLRLVVDVRVQRVLDPRLERRNDGRLDRLEAVLEIDGGECRLEDRRKDVSVASEPVDLVLREPGPRPAQPVAQIELGCDDCAARPRHDVRTHLRHPPLGELREAVEEVARDGELQHRVAEELEALVGEGAVGGPRRMREDRLRALGRKLVDQLPKTSRLGLTGAM